MSTRPVLLMDDDVRSCERICRLLASHGWTVVAVPGRTSALERMDALGTPAAVLLRTDGVTPAVREAKRWLARAAEVPFVLVNTASGIEYLPLLLADACPASAAA